MATPPFLDPLLSYEENYARGPFGSFAEIPAAASTDAAPRERFLGIPVHSTFGIPAGPLLNSRFVAAAFAHGFDLCVYKTVRSAARASHPFPNTLAVDCDGDLTPGQTLIAHACEKGRAPRSITNSYGVPSQPPDIWQPDMAAALRSAQHGQVLIGSFQGSGEGDAQIADYARTARLVVETGAPVLEANLSCPNEGKKGLLCFDLEKVNAIVDAIRKEINDRPLLLKLAYFEDDAALQTLVRALGNKVDGFCAINTLSARVVDANGRPALPGVGRESSGICGATIRWAGLSMTQKLAVLRADNDMKFAIVANGGVLTPADDAAYRQVGADAVMSATGAMWNTQLAQHIKKERCHAIT
ncbi:MAG: dihydroorotate oxidase [Proteobacteria bacterium]|nr:dihydroorotate oxidase [Pseudomonadota bacterium]MCL2308289.1 dihydroorotate oxidase [Pseudomonadota bacterium]